MTANERSRIHEAGPRDNQVRDAQEGQELEAAVPPDMRRSRMRSGLRQRERRDEGLCGHGVRVSAAQTVPRIRAPDRGDSRYRALHGDPHGGVREGFGIHHVHQARPQGDGLRWQVPFGVPGVPDRVGGLLRPDVRDMRRDGRRSARKGAGGHPSGDAVPTRGHRGLHVLQRAGTQGKHGDDGRLPADGGPADLHAERLVLHRALVQPGIRRRDPGRLSAGEPDRVRCRHVRQREGGGLCAGREDRLCRHGCVRVHLNRARRDGVQVQEHEIPMGSRMEGARLRAGTPSQECCRGGACPSRCSGVEPHGPEELPGGLHGESLRGIRHERLEHPPDLPALGEQESGLADEVLAHQAVGPADRGHERPEARVVRPFRHTPGDGLLDGLAPGDAPHGVDDLGLLGLLVRVVQRYHADGGVGAGPGAVPASDAPLEVDLPGLGVRCPGGADVEAHAVLGADPEVPGGDHPRHLRHLPGS